jgi:hypothetical protein
MHQAREIIHHKKTYDCTTAGITYHKILIGLELVQVRKSGTVDSRGLWFAKNESAK